MLKRSSFVDMTGDMFQRRLEVDGDKEEQKLRDDAESKGYQSYVRSMSWHSVVRINGRYYDYIKGGWFCVKRRPYFTKFIKTFKF